MMTGPQSVCLAQCDLLGNSGNGSRPLLTDLNGCGSCPQMCLAREAGSERQHSLPETQVSCRPFCPSDFSPWPFREVVCDQLLPVGVGGLSSHTVGSMLWVVLQISSRIRRIRKSTHQLFWWNPVAPLDDDAAQPFRVTCLDVVCCLDENFRSLD